MYPERKGKGISIMAMQNATAKKIANFKALIGNNIYTYDDLMSLMEGRKDLPSWTTLRKYNVVDVVKTESYFTKLDDTGDALLWNGWYEWDAKDNKWIIDHNFNLYGLV